MFTSIVLAILFFFVGFIAPSKVRPFQRWVQRKLKPLERKAEAAPGIATPILKAPVKATRKSAQKSLKAGKKVRDKAPF
jgi:hypothetical protein